MVATLCTMFFSFLAQDINYRQWAFTNEAVDSVALYKANWDMNEVVDWDEFFANPSGKVTMVEVKPYSGEVFFDIKEVGLYCVVGGYNSTRTVTNQTYIVIDQEFLDTMKELGWAKQIDGKLSSKPYPLRFGRDGHCHVSAESIVKFNDQKEL